ncbi:MAG: ribonuclease J [Candidatus Magasanikbacteria bacterium]
MDTITSFAPKPVVVSKTPGSFVQRRNPSRGGTFVKQNKRQQQGGGYYNRNKRAPQTASFGDASPRLRIIPLGGCEEVGRNMTLFEYGDDIVILDMGIQFPEEDMPGIDYIIPNTKYLVGKESHIRGVVFSHGHLDHIGAAPILLEKLGNPPIAGRDLTLALIKHKQEDYKKNSSKKLKMMRIKTVQDVIRLGRFTIKFFQVEHSIMDAVGVILETPAATVIHPGDWTLDRDASGKPTLDYNSLSKLRRPTVLMLESLGATNEKRSGTYEDMYHNLQEAMMTAPGRVIIGTFSSQLERIKWVLDAAQKLGKKVALDGYSMRINVEIAKELGYITVKKDMLIDVREVEKYPENKIVVVCTGAQGEENAVLMRIVNGQHKYIDLKKSDTVIFSSSVIPGNERSIQRLKDNMYRRCDNVIHGELMDVHVSGHATREDITDMLNQIKPTYFIPVYANHYFLKEAQKLAIKNGFPVDRIFVPDNGTVIEVDNKGAQVLPKKIVSDYVFVDGLGVSDTQNIVLRDRQVLAGDGMVVVIATVDSKKGTLIQNPDIISRGFVFLKDNKELIEDIRHKVKHLVIQSDPLSWADTNQIKNDIREKIGQFIFSKTEKRPMILPVVIEV